MVSPWVTICVIAFGILVAIVGVMAYLRMYKNSAWSTSRPQMQEPAPTVSEHSEERPANGAQLTDTDNE
ncbi:hypothetical protein K0T92_14690 [Paenibacillus oenotherae]|uniref:Secreted protein n=1 Tax=Paenibacillus oenotherae TaxID=1435645 RepID=A0ABS7D825_9BACL|nr:hypothetical protein [Paenibacillus oenotherae]MBW7475991.1 hypothetical protein [Paenibacillus oenotherae]